MSDQEKPSKSKRGAKRKPPEMLRRKRTLYCTDAEMERITKLLEEMRKAKSNA